MKGYDEYVINHYYNLGSEAVKAAYNQATSDEHVDLAKFELSINFLEENIRNTLENQYKARDISKTQSEFQINTFRKGIYDAISLLSKQTGIEFSCQQNFERKIIFAPTYCRSIVDNKVREQEISEDIEQIKNDKLKQRNLFSEKNKELTKEIVRIINDTIYSNHTNEEKKEIINEKIKSYSNFCTEQKKYYYSKSDIEFFKSEVKSAMANMQTEINPEIRGSELHSSFNESLHKIMSNLIPEISNSDPSHNMDGNLSDSGLMILDDNNDHLPMLGATGDNPN